jgi:hypothetical protein
MTHNKKMAAAVHREGTEMSPQELPTNPAAAGSWDPYDVWLKRVKQPRDRQLPRPVVVEARIETPSEPGAGAVRPDASVLLGGLSS